MSAERVIYALLTTYAPLIAVVPAVRIVPGVIPVDAVLPAIAYEHVVGVDYPAVHREERRLVTSRIQITVECKSYSEKKSILNLVRQACDRRNGQIAGVRVLHTRSDTVGPDFQNVQATIFSQSIDIKVQFEEIA